MKYYWEIIGDKLSKACWSWRCVSAIDSNGRTIWIADAHRDDAKHFVVRADEKLTAFLELESAIRVGYRAIRSSIRYKAASYTSIRNRPTLIVLLNQARTG
jgi:hypothetical protein